MTLRNMIGTLLLICVVLAPAAFADEKVDALEKEIAAKWKDINSMTAKMESVMDMEQQGMKMHHAMKGTMEYLRKDDKMLSRMESETESDMDMGGQKQTMKSTSLMVSDGEFMHTLSETMGQKMCVKMKADPELIGNDAMLKTLKEQNDLSMGDDETVNGDKCWVLISKAKQTQPGAPNKTCYYFRQKDGIAIQTIGYDDSGKKIMTSTLSDIKINQKIDPARFEFKVPEGVQVMDMSNQHP